MERVVIAGQPYVLKHLDLADDWTMRASGCLRGAPLMLWERGILARVPSCFNQPVVGVAAEASAGGPRSGGCALLMHDVTPWLVPVTDEPISLGQHLRFLQHMSSPGGRRRRSGPPRCWAERPVHDHLGERPGSDGMGFPAG